MKRTSALPGLPAADRSSASARIALCAPDEVVRDRIYRILSDAGHEIVAESGSLELLIQLAGDADPQLVVLARSFEPFSPGPEIAMLRARLGSCRTVIVASGQVGRAARKLVLAQADGVVPVSNLEQVLPATINCVLSNQLCIPSSARGALAQPVFSHREKQVLELVLAGLTNGEVATRLFLSESTVKSHLASTFKKLGVSSRAEVAERLADCDFGFDPSWQLPTGRRLTDAADQYI